MAGRIRQDDVEAVRERTDLVKVVSGYLQLKKTGRDSMSGLCPFHQEKTPSFSVSPAKQVFYCFGCGEGGDVYAFLRKVENLSFTEAAERLASEAGVTLRYEGTPADRRAAGRRQLLQRANGDAAALYRKALFDERSGRSARDYLAIRGIGEAALERFAVGYSPGFGDFLLRRLARSYSPEILVEAGLVSRDARGGLRDRFRGRVMFPVQDASGTNAGFGARLLSGTGSDGRPGSPKYLNSPDGPIYHKGSLLYNLNRAKADATRLGRAVIVEGYTDVIALDQAGVPAVVATCGTALGEGHLSLLSRFTERVVLAFDSDEAGARAAERAFAFHQDFPIEIEVLVLPEGQDPADFVLARGSAAGENFERLMAGGLPLVEYMIRRALSGRDLSGHESRARAIRDVLGRYVVPLSDEVRRANYARLVADRAGERESAVLEELRRIAPGRGAPGRAAPAVSGRSALTRRSPAQKVEREAMKLIVQDPASSAGELDRVQADWFVTPGLRAAFELVRELRASGGRPVTAAGLVAEAAERGGQLAKLMAALAVEPPEFEEDAGPGYARALFLRLEELAVVRRIDDLRHRLEAINPKVSPDAHSEMFQELIELESSRRRLRDAAEIAPAAP